MRGLRSIAEIHYLDYLVVRFAGNERLDLATLCDAVLSADKSTGRCTYPRSPP